MAAYESIRRAVEGGDLAAVYYLTGEEEILKDELVTSVVDAALDPSARDFNLDVRAAVDLTAESLVALVDTPPMLAERRVVVIRGLDQWRKNAKPWKVLRDYVARPSPTTILVLVSGAGGATDDDIAGHSTHVSVTAPDPETVRRWAQGRAERAGVKLTDDAANHLVTAVGGSLSHAAVEIDKLTAAVEEGADIDVPRVEEFVGIRHGETLDDWVGAAAGRDMPRALRLLGIVLPQPGMSAVKMVTALGTALVGARLARAFAEQGQNARQVKNSLWGYLQREKPRGIGPYGQLVDRWIETARKWPAADLDRALRAVYETDERLKSTTISDPKATMTSMLLRFAAVRKVA